MKTSLLKTGLTILSTFMLISALFSCSEKEKAPQFPHNTMVIDGVEMPITRIATQNGMQNDNFYFIVINYNDEHNTRFTIDTNMNEYGMETLALTQNIKDSNVFWNINYIVNGKDVFDASEDGSKAIFDSGTLYCKRLADTADGKPVMEIALKDGRITDTIEGDGKEHTVSLHYKGSLEFDDFAE